MIGDLDALLVLSLACGIAGVAVLVCGMGAVRDFMYGRHLDADPQVFDQVADQASEPFEDEPRTWVRVIESDVTPTPARRVSTRTDTGTEGAPEPVHTGGRGLLERLLSGIAAIPDVAEEPDSDPASLEAAAAAASAVATSHAGGRTVAPVTTSTAGASVERPAAVAVSDDVAVSDEPFAGDAPPAGAVPVEASDPEPLPIWSPPDVPVVAGVGATRGINRLAAALDANDDGDTPESEVLEVSIEGPARLAVASAAEPVGRAVAPEGQARPTRQGRPTAAPASLGSISTPSAPSDPVPSAESAVEAEPEPVRIAAAGEAADEAPESGIGQLAALIDLNESRRTRRSGKGHRLGLRRSPEVDEEAGARRKLPAGAERALLSIVEVQPDPRNVLALQRDPTAQVTITEVDRAAAAAAFARDREEEAASRRRHPTAHRRSA